MKEELEVTSECPVRTILDNICGKWSLLIIDALGNNGTMRFNQISKSLGDISQKMLTVTLRSLETDGILSRRMYAEIPPRVEYELTDLGQDLLPNVRIMISWAEINKQQILDNRQICRRKEYSR